MTDGSTALSRSVSGIVITGIISFSLFSCKTDEIILHGDITGIVTDATTSLPIQAASVKLNNTNDTTSSRSDGTFLLRNIVPDNYEIQSSKLGYGVSKKNVKVIPAKTQQIDILLNGIAVPGYSSTCLDFGLDSTTLSFTISNHGKGTFSYFITRNQKWITVSPSSGEITDIPDNIRVSIDKTGLSENIYNGIIEITSTGPGVLIKDTLHVNINGVADQDCNYYKVVKIGTQTWMAENLNIGRIIDIHQEQADNGYIEKWCYDCKTYGGLYNWYEAMNYNPSDTGEVGITQGICPVGWHIPTEKELVTLIEYLDGAGVGEHAGGKLKSTSPLWQAPNAEATNESGFSALPGGYVALQTISQGYFNEDPFYNQIHGIGTDAAFWLSSFYPDWVYYQNDSHPINAAGAFGLSYLQAPTGLGSQPVKMGSSVRCIKNPVKR